MKKTFKKDEIEKVIKSLNNEKSAGNDNITAQQLKYGSGLINKGITTLLNSISKTGNYPKEIKGVLVPLPKPGKTKGPPETYDQSYFSVC